MGEVGIVCKSAYKAARQLKKSTQQRSQSNGMALVSDFMATVAKQTSKILTALSQREEGRYI